MTKQTKEDEKVEVTDIEVLKVPKRLQKRLNKLGELITKEQ